MSTPKPPAATKPPPPISVTAADQAQAARDQMRQEGRRASFGKTINGADWSRHVMQYGLGGIKNTLGS